jgi:hypothetical protein
VYLFGEGGGVLGLVDEHLPDGPLQVRIVGLRDALGRLAGAEGEPFLVEGSKLYLGCRMTVEFASSAPWSPPSLLVPGGSEATLAGASKLVEAIMAHDDGPTFASLAVDLFAGSTIPTWERDSPVLRRAAEHLRALREAWRVGDGAGVGRAATGLLGLGPGLTPSGDDVLAGLLAGLRWLESGCVGDEKLADALREAVEREAPGLTTRLSARLLSHAANGLMYEPAMHLGAALFSGDVAGVQPAAGALLRIGHTTGADIAAGLVMATELCFDGQHPPTS